MKTYGTSIGSYEEAISLGLEEEIKEVKKWWGSFYNFEMDPIRHGMIVAYVGNRVEYYEQALGYAERTLEKVNSEMKKCVLGPEDNIRDFCINLVIVFGGEFFICTVIMFLGCAFSKVFLGHAESIDMRLILNYETHKAREDIFENSIQMSYNYLDQYYAQTKEQARKGFLLTILVTIVGAVIIAVGVVAMFFGQAEPAYITTAGGVIIEFISAVLFYFYNKTVQSMGSYHDKLFLSQNVSIALKVSDSIEGEKKEEIKAEIVKALIKDVNRFIVTPENIEEKK